MTSGNDEDREWAHPSVDDTRPVAERYALDEVIGAGSASVVYRGRDTETGDTVAVKVFRADGTPSDLRQQRREMAALTRLRHPGLVTLRDGGTEPGPDGRAYVVTDLVEGPTLAARVLLGPLDADTVRDLGIGLAHALAAVHEGGFVHRDVKPANVLLGDGTRPRLADFGIARALDGTVATAAGRIVGTAAYLAPEQVRGGEIGPPVDVYALGLVLLECLTGRREYPGMAAEALTARLHRPPAVPEGLPWGLTDMITVMTANDPAHRPTAAAVASGLGGSVPVAATTTALARPVTQPLATRRRRTAAARSSTALRRKTAAARRTTLQRGRTGAAAFTARRATGLGGRTAVARHAAALRGRTATALPVAVLRGRTAAAALAARQATVLRGPGRAASLLAAAAVILAVLVTGIGGFGAPPAAPAAVPDPLPEAAVAAPATPSAPQQQQPGEAPAALVRVAPAAQTVPARAAENPAPVRRSGGGSGGGPGAGQPSQPKADGGNNKKAKGKASSEKAHGSESGGDGNGQGGD